MPMPDTPTRPASLEQPAASAPVADRRRAFGMGGRAGLALLAGLGIAMVVSVGRPAFPPMPMPASKAPPAPHTLAGDAMAGTAMPVKLRRFALQAFLAPLLDDSEPHRWTDVALDFNCEPGTGVMVDGKPMDAGAPIPSTAFTVRWNMVRCAPFGRESMEISGIVELFVFHEDEGLGAIVSPEVLQIDSAEGRAWVNGPFAADMLHTTSVKGSDKKERK